MKLFPASAVTQLEFDKIRNLLEAYCNMEYSKAKANDLRIHTRLEFIQPQLQQTNEYKLIVQSGLHFPGSPALSLARELKLIGIPGAILSAEQFVSIRKLCEHMKQVFRWFDPEHEIAYPALSMVIKDSYYEKVIVEMINDVLDTAGRVKDDASEALSQIRYDLYKKRNELRRLFDRVIKRLNKDGYLADIEESFMNGRRVLAVFAEQKRMVRGILHGESDSRRTSFIEPEETTDLSNQVYSLEQDEVKEINRILQALTSSLSVYAHLLNSWYQIIGEYDFIHAKAKIAIDYKGNYPSVQDKPTVHLMRAFHPLLYLYNKKTAKETVPVSITLDDKKRILVISGPNAGGKTVTLKTVGLLQMMLQSGLLVPCDPDSVFGIFRQLMIHIGDTQSLEFELSTYSSHLRNMKHFMETASGKTLFFIDELGSGSDPNLGGAFAEVIMEELAKKHSIGIVTTHYLNLKVMANKVAGIINGAMAFDEQNLLPLYQLTIGKPGSSYTFAIAERIGLSQELIKKARLLVDEDHFSLDKLLNRTEQDLQQIDKEKKDLEKLVAENKTLKREMEMILDKEKHLQQVELLTLQNKMSQLKLTEMKDLERNLKSLVIEWRKSEDKTPVIKQMTAVLFKQREKHVVANQQKKINDKFQEVGGEITSGSKVKMKSSRQVGTVREIRGKKAIIQVGVLPITVNLEDLIQVIEK